MLLLSLLVCFSFAAEQQQTLCEKYSQALGVNQIQLMTTIVSTVVNAEVSDPIIRLFFNGMVPPGSTNFLNNTAAFNRLAGNLIAYFGNALGCGEPGFPSYTGNPDMKALHANMPIDQDTFQTFNNVFISALNTLGVTLQDQTTIALLLESFAGNIVNPRTICPKYAGALGISELELMTAVINAVVKKELADPSILPFFNGQTPPGSINFLTNSTAFSRLANNLIAFFGGALGCTKNFPPYMGNPNMKNLHAKMPIDMALFSNFNNNLQQAVADLGVSRGDQITIRMILDSFASSIINR